MGLFFFGEFFQSDFDDRWGARRIKFFFLGIFFFEVFLGVFGAGREGGRLFFFWGSRTELIVTEMRGGIFLSPGAEGVFQKDLFEERFFFWGVFLERARFFWGPSYLRKGEFLGRPLFLRPMQELFRRGFFLGGCFFFGGN